MTNVVVYVPVVVVEKGVDSGGPSHARNERRRTKRDFVANYRLRCCSSGGTHAESTWHGNDERAHVCYTITSQDFCGAVFDDGGDVRQTTRFQA